MEYREVKIILCIQKGERFVKYLFIAAVFAPPIVVTVYIREVDFLHWQILPLDACVEHVQDVIENLEVREVRPLSIAH